MVARSEDFKTSICRFSYIQNMFVPVKRTQDDGSPMLDKNGKQVIEWQATLIFDNSTDKTPFDNAIRSVIVEEWGEGGLLRAKNGLIKQPYLKGDGKEARNKKTGEINPGLGEDKWFLRVATRIEPPVRYRSATIPATHGNGDDQIKSGDYGFAVLQAYTWHAEKSGDGVSFGIQYLQKTKAGESLGGGGGVDVDKYHEKIDDQGAAPEATKTGAGAGGLFG